MKILTIKNIFIILDNLEKMQLGDYLQSVLNECKPILIF